jgi:biopolymer transport protein ExbB
MKMSLRTLGSAAVALTIFSATALPSMAQQPAGGAGPRLPATVPATRPPPPASTAASPSPLPAPVQAQPEPAPTEISPAGEDAGKATALGLRDFSPWGMFLSADALVKAVMLSLVFASLVTWTIFIAKSVQLSRAQRNIRAALGRITEARSLNEAQIALGAAPNVLTTLLTAASQEIRMSADSGVEGSIKERAASRFSEIVRMEARAVRYGMASIATIGATAPFVGLFGTVWGIMDSFIGISKAQTTNLAVVAPGIAEALLATAIGLAAAIPAVIIYNHFSRLTKGYLELVGRGSGAIGRLLSRDLDRFHGRLVSRAAE